MAVLRLDLAGALRFDFAPAWPDCVAEVLPLDLRGGLPADAVRAALVDRVRAWLVGSVAAVFRADLAGALRVDLAPALPDRLAEALPDGFTSGARIGCIRDRLRALDAPWTSMVALPVNIFDTLLNILVAKILKVVDPVRGSVGSSRSRCLALESLGGSTIKSTSIRTVSTARSS